MNKAIIGIERDVVLASIISDKTPLMIRPLVLKDERVESMTLKYTEYRIFSQGILFFQKLFPQWYKLQTWQSNNPKNTGPRVQITFFYRGRGLYFVSSLKRVQNGYALVVPEKVIKMTDFIPTDEKKVSAKVYHPGDTLVQAHCLEKEGFNLFENRVWLNFSEQETKAAEKYLKQIAGLTKATLLENCMDLLERTKLILYIPDKKIPNRNYFPYTATVTTDDVETIESVYIEPELAETTYDTYIPLATTPAEKVHSIFGMKAKMVVTSPIDISERLLLLPVCRFFIQNNKNESPVQGRAESLSILYITDSVIVLGGMTALRRSSQVDMQPDSEGFPLQQGLEYTLQLSIPLVAMKRLIKVSIFVSHIFKNEKGSICVLCRFSNLQEEDKRFLYEKFNDTLCK